MWYLASLRVPFLWWQRHVNGFVLVRREAAARTFIFECTHFDPVTRACDSYESRPGLCRDYPRLLLDQPFPEMLPGCGYVPLARNAEALRRALDAQPLTSAQRARVIEGLGASSSRPRNDNALD